MIKKLFSLAAAVLVCAGVWAADETIFSANPLQESNTEVSYSTATTAEVTSSQATITGGKLTMQHNDGTNKRVFIRKTNNAWVFSIAATKTWFEIDLDKALQAGDVISVSALTAGSGADKARGIWICTATSRPSSAPACELKAQSGTGTEFLTVTYTVKESDDINGQKKLYIWRATGNTTDFKELVITRPQTCTDPESTIKGDTTLYVNNGYNIGFNSINTNGCTVDVQKNGAAAVDDVDYSKTNINNYTFLKAGEFVITISQAKDANNHCAVEESVTVTVLDANPVTAVSIDGPTAAYVGYKLTYTATAANATAYEWYLDDVKQGSDSAKFIYTAVKGNHSIVCKARNKFNEENEWIASDPIALKVTSLYGEIIKATLTSGTAATVTGVVGGTADVSLSSSKKMDKGKYFGITLASGAFQEGDTVVITMSTAGQNYPCLFGDKAKTKLLYLATETSSALEYKIVLPAEANGLTSLYLVRDADDAKYKWNPVLSSIAVIRPKAVDHADVTLVGATIDGVALSEEDLTTLLTANELNIATSYVNAPVVAFVKHTDTYYEGEAEPVSTNDSIKVTATEVEGKWQAQATIGTETYTITLAKTASFTVHYMDGENELGTENVEANGTVAKYADFQSKTLATFDGWYQDVDLTIEYILTAPVTAETYLYAKFENVYATSINIEQLVLDNSKSYNLLNALGTNGYATNWTNDLDSLTEAKAGSDRNYPYLGEKVKAAGKMIDFRLAQGSTVKVKFGNAPDPFQVVINGVENTVEAAALATPYEYTATEETYISIRSTTTKTLVFKQIMINEDIQTVVLPALYTVTYNAGDGTCAVAKAETQFAGDKVVLPAVTPAENYEFDGWYDAATDGTKVGVAGAEYAPEANITLYAYYTPAGGGSAINNTDAAVKTVKVIRNGQLIIIRDGKEFNVLGAAVK